MKKILLKVVAILGLVCFSHATTSANIVGYAKINVTAGELQLCALNFTPSSTSVSDLIGNQLDNGSAIYKWDKSTGTYAIYNKGGRGWPGSFSSQVIGPTDGIWVESTGVSWTESRPFDLDS
jgi:hypothetical protein